MVPLFQCSFLMRGKMGKVNVLRVYTDSKYSIQRTLLRNRLVIRNKKVPNNQNKNILC